MVTGTEWIYFLKQDSPKIYPAIKIRVERIDREQQIAILQINSTFNPVNDFSNKLFSFVTYGENVQSCFFERLMSVVYNEF